MKMSQIEYNDLYQLLPFSVVNNVVIVCFVTYDQHPRDNKEIDITICLKQGEVREYYQKDLVSSIIIPFTTNFSGITIVRSSKCELYYLIEAHDEIIILSRKDNLNIHQRFHLVKKYELCDLKNTGDVTLKIVTEHTTKYYSIDNGFQNINEINENTNSDGVCSALGSKLKELVNNLEVNKKAYNQILNLRQRAAYYTQNPNDVKIEPPLVQFCNKKVVILLRVGKTYKESMENVCVLIHNNSSNSISYTTKYFDDNQVEIFPGVLFRETDCSEPRFKAIIVAVIPLKEFKRSLISKIEFNLVVSYQRQGKEYLLPCKNIYVSASDVMGKNFDVLSNATNRTDKLWIFLSTEKTTLCFRQIISLDQQPSHNHIEPIKIFCNKPLNFELLDIFEGIKIAAHRFSPHHVLHGMMIVFHGKKELVKAPNNFEFNFKMDVYTRNPSQVLALLHYINDGVPETLIVTTPNIKVTNNSETQDEEMDIS